MSGASHSAERIAFLGFAFDPLEQNRALERIDALRRSDRFNYVMTPNVDHAVTYARAAANDPLREAYDEADLVLCDSRILQLLARWSGLDLPLVTGSDLTLRLLREVDAAGDRRIAVVGGDAALLADLKRIYPRIAWTQYAPPMGVRRDPAAREAIARFVEDAGCDTVLFAIGAPQSEIVCHEIAKRVRARGVALCIGASLEFATGTKRRAPASLQAMRLEWLFRLASEPRRLWRRYLVEGPRIVAIWLRWLARRPRPLAGSSPNPTGRT